MTLAEFYSLAENGCPSPVDRGMGFTFKLPSINFPSLKDIVKVVLPVASGFLLGGPAGLVMGGVTALQQGQAEGEARKQAQKAVTGMQQEAAAYEELAKLEAEAAERERKMALIPGLPAQVAGIPIEIVMVGGVTALLLLIGGKKK